MNIELLETEEAVRSFNKSYVEEWLQGLISDNLMISALEHERQSRHGVDQ